MLSECLLIKKPIQKIGTTVLKFLDHDCTTDFSDWRLVLKNNIPIWNTFSFQCLLIFTDWDLTRVTNDDSRLSAQIRSCTCRSYSTTSKYSTKKHWSVNAADQHWCWWTWISMLVCSAIAAY